MGMRFGGLSAQGPIAEHCFIVLFCFLFLLFREAVEEATPGSSGSRRRRRLLRTIWTIAHPSAIVQGRSEPRDQQSEDIRGGLFQLTSYFTILLSLIKA